MDSLETAIRMLIPLATVGVISMAIIQTLKSVFPLKRMFHKFILRKLFTKDEDKRLLKEWLSLCSGEEIESKKKTCRVNAFYEQETNKLFQELKSVAESAIDFPTSQTYSDLFDNLCSYLGEMEDPKKQWTEYFKNGSNENVSPKELEGRNREAQAARDIIYTRVSQDISSLERIVLLRWAQINQFIAVAISIVLLYNFQSIEGIPLFSDKSNVSYLGYVIYLLAGGVLAPFAKDLMTSLIGAKNMISMK